MSLQSLDDTITIRAMCDQFDVTPRTLRFYEQIGLLFPIRAGTQRHFTKRDRVRMTLICRGKRMGFSLEDIRQILDIYDVTKDAAAQFRFARELAARRLAEMEAEQADMERRIAELRQQISATTEILRDDGQPIAACHSVKGP